MSEHGRVVRRDACPECGSRDNVAVYETGYEKCFGQGCEYWKGNRNAGSSSDGGVVDRGVCHTPTMVRAMIPVEYMALSKRGISEETCKRFHYGVGTTHAGEPVQVAQYGTAQKIRTADKKFSWINRPEGGPELFGQSLWRPQKRLVITEGEIDALSYAQATDCRWPVVSVPDGASSAARSIALNIEFVEGFEEVVFLFDMDTPGQAAAEECALLLTPGKARIASLPRKDANEVLLELGGKTLYLAPFSARVFRPDGIVEGLDILQQVLTPPEEGLSYPWPCLDAKTHGMRRGEMVTWIAGTGTGKSQVLREVAHHIWKEHGERVGIIALEESNVTSALAQISLAMDLPLHLPEVRASVTSAEIEQAGKLLLPGFAFYDHFGSVEGDVLLPKIRYMAHSMGIKWIILDHISIMVSGTAAEGDERKRLDQLVTQLRSLCSELDIGIHVVSHLRKSSGQSHEEGGQISLQDIRSSGAPAQLSNLVIALERDQQAEDGAVNVTSLRILKNRFSGETGITGALLYSLKTGRLMQAQGVKSSGSITDF